MSFSRRKKGFFSSSEYQSRPRHGNIQRPFDENTPLSAPLLSKRPSDTTMSKLQSFIYKPNTPLSGPRPKAGTEKPSNPATPMPQRIPLSDLISSTPSTRQEVGQDISPDDKIVWKLSPKKTATVPQASQESPNAKMTNFINFLQDEHGRRNVSRQDIEIMKMLSPNATRPRNASFNRLQENSPQTPSARKIRPLPGPSPLSLKRSATFGNSDSVERPRKRRTRSSDVSLQTKVSSLLEQAQSYFRNDDRSSSPQAELEVIHAEVKINSEEYAFEGDMDLLEAEGEVEPLTSDKPEVEAKETLPSESTSDELFDADFDLQPEDFEALDISSNPQNTAVQNAGQSPEAEEDALFGDGYDELMDLDFDDTQPEEDAQQSMKRCKVISVQDSSFLLDNKQQQQQMILEVQDDNSKQQYTIYLRGDWTLTQIEEKDIINVIGTFANNTCIVDNLNGLLILHPDTLVSSTHVADSFKCIRRAVLQDRIRATGETTQPLVFGHIIHELFQEAISVMDFSTSHLESLSSTLITRHIEDLYSINMTPDDAAAYLQDKIYLLQAWAHVFVAAEPSEYSFMADHCGSTSAKPKVSINKVLDIEEHVWSPTYGLKGNIDATVQVRIEEPDVPTRTLIVPLEVKTGKNTSLVNHRAQTMLYTLMMSDRYDVDVNCGMLYYVEAKESIRVRALRHEVRGLIMGRNELARLIRARDQLPEMIRSERDCKNCYAADSCLVYHKTMENGNAQTSGLGKWFEQQTDHLDERDTEFLKSWDSLLNKEEADMFRFKNELWTMLSTDREKLGRCFANLVIIPEETVIDKNGEKINRYRYLFRRADTSTIPNTQSRSSFLNSQINIGDPIVVSDESGHFALANGFVTDLQPDMLKITVDRRLHGARTKQLGFDPLENQSFTGIVEMTSDGEPRLMSQLSTEVNTTITYRVDKDEFQTGMAVARNNIIQLFTKDGDLKRRELIVGNRPPQFRHPDQRTQYSYFEKQDSLNGDQKRAVEKVLTAEDYALVLGMPGTGKTTTIAHIIRALVENGKSVLLTSYTHTAVDNILLKLISDNIKMLRLGSIAKVHPEVRRFAVGGGIKAKTFEELNELYTTPLVVATTCLGINHFIFNKRRFDYCIVDEASQITLPVCLGPLRYADRFILVGDHYQLSPLVRNEEARNGGLDISLFKKLSDAYPEAMTILEHQYRMNEDIMLLSNSLVYDGMLKCGNENVAKRKLQIPDRRALSIATPWVRDILSDRFNVVFCDTDQVPALETKQGNRTINTLEAKFIKETVDTLRKGGISASSIGVMSVYRSQLKLLSHLLSPEHPDIEIYTADRFQGRDKDVVIISLVRSNQENYIGELLQDWRRVNVAFTRAKSKLIIFGSRSTIRETQPLDKFVHLVETKGWVYQIPSREIGKSPRKESPRKVLAKENIPPSADGSSKKIMKINGSTVLKGRPVLWDIVNEHR